MRKAWLIPVVLVLALAGGTRLLHSRISRENPAPVRWRDSLNEAITNDLSSLPEMDQVVDSFMTFWHLRGVSLSISRNDSLLYARGYGKADTVNPMTPGTTLRLASVSKLLTAVGIMRLQERRCCFWTPPSSAPMAS